MKRLLDCTPREMLALDKPALLAAMAHSEGRVIACETIGVMPPMLGDVTNAEFVASQGADLLLLNLFDVMQPTILGLPACPAEDTVRTLKALTGRPIGINLEPILHDSAIASATQWTMTAGRRATVENARKAANMGVDFILLTGNPGMGVSNDAIISALHALKAAVGQRVILAAGKMHAAGAPNEGGTDILKASDIEAFAQAGADVILLPAPGTVPGITLELAHTLIARIHACGSLAMTSIGTSQEGADTETIRRIALLCKQAGADIHHLGDTGYNGMALPENIAAYSIAIRGIRHTYRRQAASVNR